MIHLKSPREQEKMRRAGALLAGVFAGVARRVAAGAVTADIDAFIEDSIRSAGARPAFKNYRGSGDRAFPASACISVDAEVVHGIPSARRLEPGQVVGVDAGLELDGWYADMAASFLVGRVDERRRMLWRVTREALYKGIEKAVPGGRVKDIGAAVQDWVEQHGLYVIRELVGHGVGSRLHEEPAVPNYRTRDADIPLQAGMTLAIEPMVALGTWKIKVLRDGWTAVTADGSASAHFEHSILVTDDGPEILTLFEDGRDPWLQLGELSANDIGE